jgi:hypothetical protein
MIMLLVTTCVAALAAGFRNTMDPSILAYSLQNITDVVGLLQLTLRMGSELQNFMTSSKRMIEYTELPSEDNLRKENDK